MNEILPDIDTIVTGKAIQITDLKHCKRYIKKSKKSLTLITQNIRSINHNFNDFELLLSRIDFDVELIVLTECWLSSNTIIPSITGYTSYITEKQINQNSGVTVYVKDNLKQVKVSEPQIDDANCLLIEIHNHTAIICIYRPPSVFSVNKFQIALDKLLNDLKKYQNIILVGDINIDIKVGNTDGRSTEYLNLLASHTLLPVHTIPTRLANCIDHCLAKTKNETSTIICQTTITDHYTVIVNFYNDSINKHDIPNKTQQTDYQALLKELSNIDWHSALSICKDGNSATKTFLERLSELYTKHTQVKYISKRKHCLKPWVTQGLLRCIKFRDTLHQKAKKEPDNKDQQTIYKRYRNHCNKILKNLKKQYEINLIHENKNNTKKTWQAIKQICNLEKKTIPPNELLKNSNSTATINTRFISERI